MANDRKDGVEGEDEAAHDAEPKSEEEKQAMREAERIGKKPAKK